MASIQAHLNKAHHSFPHSLTHSFFYVITISISLFFPVHHNFFVYFVSLDTYYLTLHTLRHIIQYVSPYLQRHEHSVVYELEWNLVCSMDGGDAPHYHIFQLSGRRRTIRNPSLWLSTRRCISEVISLYRPTLWLHKTICLLYIEENVLV